VDVLLPVGITLVTWWLSTLLLLRLSMRARPRCRPTLAFVSMLAAAGLVGLAAARGQATVAGAYLGFVSALAVWAWLEMSYFLGFVTGPRPRACPPGLPAAQRFRYGVLASLHHELAVVLAAALIVVFHWQAANPVGAWTFLLLWWMRWSAKINIFLGVRNLHTEFWPEHLQYLGSYVGGDRINRLFPVTLLVAGAAVVWLVAGALASLPGSYERTAQLLLATLLGLATLEHVFLVIRLPDALLWRWAGGRDSAVPDVGASVRTGLRAGQGS
jgi:putative photosynthetic complex assembly protein 2